MRLWHWITRPWRSPPPPEPSGHDDRIRRSQLRQDEQAARLARVRAFRQAQQQENQNDP